MNSPNIGTYAKRELQYQLRRKVTTSLRESCPQSDPMVAFITVSLGSILAMAALDAILNRAGESRTR